MTEFAPIVVDYTDPSARLLLQVAVEPDGQPLAWLGDHLFDYRQIQRLRRHLASVAEAMHAIEATR